MQLADHPRSSQRFPLVDNTHPRSLTLLEGGRTEFSRDPNLCGEGTICAASPACRTPDFCPMLNIRIPRTGDRSERSDTRLVDPPFASVESGDPRTSVSEYNVHVRQMKSVVGM